MERDSTREEILNEAIFQGLGEASVCWSETPKGVFDSDRAKLAGERILDIVHSQIVQAIEEEKVRWELQGDHHE